MNAAPPEERVAAMFDRVVDRYDLVNTLLSMGLDARWRREAAQQVPSLPGDRVLDLGCGTGKLGELLASRAHVVGADISERMLEAARRQRGDRMRVVRASAFAIPFADGAFRGAVSGFVLRNLNDLPAAFAELARVLAPGGAIALVDITGPRGGLLRRPFDAYFSAMAPLLGRLTGDAGAYRYLARSLAQLPPPGRVREMLDAAGFERTDARPLTGGMVTLWTGVRA